MSVSKTYWEPKGYGQDFLVFLSLANLMFFKPWSDLILLTEKLPIADWAYESLSTRASTYVGIMLDVTLCGIILWSIVFIGQKIWGRKGWYIAHLLLFPLSFFVANGIRLAFRLGYLTSLVPKWVLTILLLSIAATLSFLIFRFLRQMILSFRLILVMLLPFVIVTFGHAFYGLIFESRPPESLAASTVNTSEKTRIIWWLFDEWDYRLSFEERPNGLRLHEIDRFQSEAFSGQRVFPPGSHTTVSIPSYFIGKTVDSPPWVARGREVKGTIQEGQDFHWPNEQTLFSEINKLGGQSSIVGWYLPYCQMLSGQFNKCRRYPHYNLFKQPYSDSLLISMFNFVEEGSYFFPNRATFQVETYNRVFSKTFENINDPDLTLLFTHWPTPHAPWIFDSTNGEVADTNHKGPEGYLDNLLLVDRTLGKLRLELEQKGMWDETTILLTSDHGWNSSPEYDGKFDPRVPFLVKLKNQKSSLSYQSAFNAILLKDLLIAIHKGEVSSLNQLKNWIDQHGPSTLPNLKS